MNPWMLKAQKQGVIKRRRFCYGEGMKLSSEVRPTLKE